MNEQQLIEKYESQLNEEKWTRTAINNYTIKNFEDLDALVQEFSDNHIRKEISVITSDYLSKNRNSIIALYISTVFQLEEGRFEDGSPYSLLKIFSDNLKWNIVEYIALKINNSGLKDKLVIRSLLEALTNLGKKDEIERYWEELIKVDYEEISIVLKIAEKRESENKRDEAISYYKKAINRSIHIKNFTQIEEVWKKLLTFDEVGCDFFLGLEKKIYKAFSIDKVVDLLMLVYENYKKQENWDICIKLLKIILDYDSHNEYGREEIVLVYRKKYANHSHLDEYIKRSNLDGKWRTIGEAISSFEKHISIDVGNFVYHRDWGIGLIKSVDRDDFIIDFEKSRNHKMSLKLAISSLRVLPKNHIWVLKLKNIEKLKTKVVEDPLWAMKILIKSYNNNIKLKEIKTELVSADIITQGKWNNWWSKTKELMRNDPIFGTLDENSDVYMLRDRPISVEERTANAFKASKDFMQRFNIAYQYYQYDSDPDPDLLEEMVAYFKTHAKVIDIVNEQTIISFLLLELFQKKYSFLKVEMPSFKELINNVEDPLDIYEAISLQELRNDFLRNIKECGDGTDESAWQETYIRLFFLYPSAFIYEELDKASSEDRKYVKQLVHDLMVAYREYREAFFWLVPRVLSSKEKADEFGVNYETVLFSLLHLIELAGNSITIKKETTKNKKLQNQVRDYLFKNSILENYIETASEDFANRLYKITIDLNYLGEEDKIKIKDKIAECYPEIVAKYRAAEEVESSESKIKNYVDKLLTLRKSLEEKKKELAYIEEVEVPKNSKDIGDALEKGDLRENSEYKAAKEKESQLAARVVELVNGINKAIIIESKDVNASTVSFGTRIEVLENDELVKFTILGPWESDIENNILSYKSPLGMALFGKKVGDVVSFNDKKYSIKSIEVADFE